jgi:hypothetical protein
MLLDSPNVRRISDPNNTTGTAAYLVTIPLDIRGGQQFPVTIQGQGLTVTCPQNARPGMSVRVVPPPPPTDLTRAPSGPMGQPSAPRPPKDEITQLIELEVPRGVQPGRPFALLSVGQPILVPCPPNANPGSSGGRPKVYSEAAKIEIMYDKDGWTRTVRLTDMKLQWVRMDDRV